MTQRRQSCYGSISSKDNANVRRKTMSLNLWVIAPIKIRSMDNHDNLCLFHNQLKFSKKNGNLFKELFGRWAKNRWQADCVLRTAISWHVANIDQENLVQRLNSTALDFPVQIILQRGMRKSLEKQKNLFRVFRQRWAKNQHFGANENDCAHRCDFTK